MYDEWVLSEWWLKTWKRREEEEEEVLLHKNIIYEVKEFFLFLCSVSSYVFHLFENFYRFFTSLASLLQATRISLVSKSREHK